MTIQRLALLALVASTACGNALADFAATSTVGLTTTYLETFEGSTSFSGGRVEAGSDDFMWLTTLNPTATYTFSTGVALASLSLSFWYSVPRNNSGSVSLGSLLSTTLLPDTPGNAAEFLINNPGSPTGGPLNADDFDAQYTSATFNNVAIGSYVLTLGKLGGPLNSLKVDDVQFTVTAVPEPETYALMLGGLGLVGWVARRRRPGRD